MIKSVIIIAASAAIAIFMAGCNSGNTDAAPSTSSPTASATTGAAGTTGATATPVAYKNTAGKLECPVMHTEIESEAKAAGYQDHDGKRFYFCCEGCPEEFKADPAKYASTHSH
jgi:YHS domain-containing protein